MSNQRSTPRPRAGEAFRAEMLNDPAVQAALARAQARLRAFAEVMKSPAIQREREHARQEEEEALKELAKAMAEAAETAGEDLAEQGFTPPTTIEEWEHLAAVVEMPFETIQAGRFTARDVYVMALAWMDRQEILARKLADSISGPDQQASDVKALRPPVKGRIGNPEPHPHDHRKAMWGGKYIYLGNNTQVSRLFWLLAKPVGRPRTMGEVQRAVDGVESDPGYCGEEEARKACLRVRKAVSKLRERLREARVDEHAAIVREGQSDSPEYTMLWRW